MAEKYPSREQDQWGKVYPPAANDTDRLVAAIDRLTRVIAAAEVNRDRAGGTPLAFEVAWGILTDQLSALEKKP